MALLESSRLLIGTHKLRDGTEAVFDDDTNPNNADASVLVLGDGISQGAIKFKPGSLAIDLGPSNASDPNSPHDVIHFEGFNQLDPTATTPLSEIRFADGSSMSYADILARGFDIDGTAGNDNGQPGDAPQLVGTSVTDRIRGFGGNDVLFTGRISLISSLATRRMFRSHLFDHDKCKLNKMISLLFRRMHTTKTIVRAGFAGAMTCHLRAIRRARNRVAEVAVESSRASHDRRHA